MQLNTISTRLSINCEICTTVTFRRNYRGLPMATMLLTILIPSIIVLFYTNVVVTPTRLNFSELPPTSSHTILVVLSDT